VARGRRHQGRWERERASTVRVGGEARGRAERGELVRGRVGLAAEEDRDNVLQGRPRQRQAARWKRRGGAVETHSVGGEDEEGADAEGGGDDVRPVDGEPARMRTLKRRTRTTSRGLRTGTRGVRERTRQRALITSTAVQAAKTRAARAKRPPTTGEMVPLWGGRVGLVSTCAF
jgi:hypothetical protein